MKPSIQTRGKNQDNAMQAELGYQNQKMPPWTQLYCLPYSLHGKGSLKYFEACVYVTSETSSVITYIKKHRWMQKDNNSEASQLLAHSLFYGAFLPQEHLISTGSSYLQLKIITWKLRNVTLVQDNLKNVFQQVSNCSVLTQRSSTNYTKLYSGCSMVCSIYLMNQTILWCLYRQLWGFCIIKIFNNA